MTILTDAGQPATVFTPEHDQPSRDRPRVRLDAVDILRGVVMVIMMLDHTRDMVNATSFQFDPTDLTKTTGALFFTRWITHFCAPVFVLLAGASASFQRQRGKPVGELSRFLVKRGFWLIVLEFTVVKFAMWFNVVPTYLATLQVIWVIGVSMIVLAGLIRFPTWLVGAFGVAMIVLHDAANGFHVTAWNGPGSPVPSAGAKLWIIFHQGGQIPVAGWPSPVVFALYPLIPWIGVMAAGYAFGTIYSWDWERRRNLLVRLGTGCIVAFFVLRVANIYGDPSRWSVQPRTPMTIVSFFNVTKYPASLLFLLMTLGPGFLALAGFERWRTDSRLRNILVTYGRVPLFYYILQWATAHAIAILLSLAAGKSVAYLFMNPQDLFTHVPPGAGFPLWVTWVAWIVGVVLLYPACKWYAGVKARRRDWWLSYL